MGFSRHLELATRLVTKAPSPFYEIARAGQNFLDRLRIMGALRNGKPLVLIYQHGRVASTSVYASVRAANLRLPVFHVHTLSAQKASLWIERAKKNNRRVDRNFVVGKLIGQAITALGNNPYPTPWKIICIFRDPISVVISLHFMNVKRYFTDVINGRGQIDTDGAIQHFQKLFHRDDPSGWGLSKWFDDVFFKEIGVDVYKCHFDFDRGYKIINSEHFEILLLSFENLSTAFKKGGAILFGIDEDRLNLLHSHLHKEDMYAEAHAFVKKHLKLPRSTCEKIYSTKFIKHFYSPAQIENMINKWSGD